VEVDDIISYHDIVAEERAALQKGMNFGMRRDKSGNQELREKVCVIGEICGCLFSAL
jgi:hypothetical protein